MSINHMKNMVDALEWALGRILPGDRGDYWDRALFILEKEKQKQWPPEPIAFQHDEALLNDLLTELASRTEEPWIAPEASVRSSMIRDVAKTYAMQMLRRISE